MTLLLLRYSLHTATAAAALTEYYAHICRKVRRDNDTPLQPRVVKFGMRGSLVSPPCAEMSQIQINETDPPSAMREWILAHSLPESLEPLLIGAGIVFPEQLRVIRSLKYKTRCIDHA